ncbi:MAG: hypothetical protein AMQ22_02311 [Candidatus Methanofastidiosum methylothiophilum]|uniref:Uncharacterized protein n=1 Tax=Candidatus Methanofastidiosum methylothiophilum TaxID=1705564 RepID=A0A150IHJ4_9EURY|nr:MAG: hypothetical protein AMQ22_02311 [Candidatus Methanofastidiosum methylthiophilus]
MINKNGYDFEIKVETAEIDQEKSEERSEELSYNVEIVHFYITVTEVTKDARYNYEIIGNIEYDEYGQDEIEFDDGSQYRSYVTLVGGDVQDREFNAAVKDFFSEDCDVGSLVYDNLSDEDIAKIEKLQN